MALIFPAAITATSLEVELIANRATSLSLPPGFPQISGAFATDGSPSPIQYLGPGKSGGSFEIQAPVSGTYVIWAYSAP